MIRRPPRATRTDTRFPYPTLFRSVHFVSGLLEAGVEFIAADMPQANKVMIQMYSVMAEWERDQISARTKAALAAAKGRSEEHTSELQSLMRNSYAVFCLKKKNKKIIHTQQQRNINHIMRNKS